MSSVKKGDLTENEKKLIEAALHGSIEEIGSLLSKRDVFVDCLDSSGMTPLHHAAFKGKLDAVKLLLAHGADVNSPYHEQDYSVLMMGAISGNVEVTRTLLEAGAKPSRENKVGRTATQMAAFVGQHQCVSLINNFFSREDLDYYCVPRGLETEPKLPPELADSVYRLILNSTLNPVRITLLLKSHSQILSSHKIICKLLDLLCEKMMKSTNTNEIMAIKFHYLSYILKTVAESYEKDNSDLNNVLKSLLRIRTDGCFELTEKLIRGALKTFPYVESQLFKQLIRQLCDSNMGVPSALSVLSSGINGQRFASEEDKECECCGELKAKMKCSACKMVYYCNVDCQKLQWFVHKKQCKRLAEIYKENEERKQQEKEEEEQRKQEEEKKKLLEEKNKANLTENLEECQEKISEILSEKEVEKSQ